MKEIVIFGNRDLAEMAHFYLTQSGKQVKAFTLDNPQEWSFKGCPVFDFKDIVDIVRLKIILCLHQFTVL